MREIYYNANVTLQPSQDIKLLALYYDRINMVNDHVYSDFIDSESGKTGIIGRPLIPQDFQNEYRLLLDADMMRFTKQQDEVVGEFEERFSTQIGDVIRAHQETIPKNNSRDMADNPLTAEVYSAILFLINEKNKPDGHTGPHYIWHHYAFKFKSFLELLKEGKTCVSSSEMLNYIFSVYIDRFNNEQKDVDFISNKSIAIDALKIALPNPGILSLEDILELKLRLKDELTHFYQAMNAIEVNHKLYDTEVSQEEYQAIFHTEIDKPLRELKTKMANLKSKSFRQFVDRLKDYKTYVPMIGGVVTSLPLQYTVLASLGLTIGQSYLEFMEQQREIQDNGLYFLLKIK